MMQTATRKYQRQEGFHYQAHSPFLRLSRTRHSDTLTLMRTRFALEKCNAPELALPIAPAKPSGHYDVHQHVYAPLSKGLDLSQTQDDAEGEMLEGRAGH